MHQQKQEPNPVICKKGEEVRTKIIMAWSGGKDSANALNLLQQEESVQVVGLLTTVSTRYNRISMHGVRNLLLEAQARALGLKVYRIPVPESMDNRAYEAAMAAVLEKLKKIGVEYVAYGDLHLEDIRAYRETMMKPSGVKALFPLWGQPTWNLAKNFINQGFKASIVCLDSRVLSPAFLGQAYDNSFLRRLPKSVDPCGENGEFHTFVHDGPNFRHPVHAVLGTSVVKSGFYYMDLLPLSTPQNS